MKKILSILLFTLACVSINAQVVLNLTGQRVNSTYTTAHSSITTFTCTNNLFQMSNTSGYMLNSGDEIVGSDNQKLNRQIVRGNKFDWGGTVAGDNGPATHACFTGYNINCDIRYNYQNNTPSGFQMKSSGLTNTSGGVAYNIMNNIGLTAIPVKGMKNVLIYNNTFRSTQVMYQNGDVGVWRGLIDIYANTDEGQDPATSNSSGCVIKNNIFYTVHQIYNIAVHDAQSASGFVCDYNVYYCEAGTPIFNYLETEYTFAQWQALGYDQHSVVLDPNFNNTTDLVPSARLNYGTTLTGFETGLATTATWVVGSTPSTAVQNGTWQVGAIIYGSSGVIAPTVTTNAVTSITGTTATCGGNVTADGGATVSARGVCWGTSSSPTTANSHTNDGTGTGSYSSSITGLTNGVTYYVRAYATNSAGTSYGGETSFTTSSGAGGTYYVSTKGSNSNSGSITSPWLTWDYGVNHISAGDILYIRGGTYTPASGYVVAGVMTAVGINGKNGTSSSPYQVYAYPGEYPILDCMNITSASYEHYGLIITNSTYWHFKGLEIKNCPQQQTGTTYGGQGFYASGATYITFENCVADYNQGPGMGTRDVNEVLFLNCDSHDNYDPYSSSFPGDNADGFDIGFQQNDNIVRLTGCRSWNNSDDGFDCYQYSGYTGKYIFTNCWAWHQGYRSDQTTQGGDGNGFKLGLDAQSYTGVTKRTLINCIAFNNRVVGFSQQSANVKMEFYNNVSYLNGANGYEFTYYNCADILRNNISYQNGSADVFQSSQTRDHNSWNGHTVTNADFASVNSSSLTASRRSDGSLPVISFLHLASSSGLIAAGANLGSPYLLDGDGVAWNGVYDIGAFKSGVSSAILVTNITVTSTGNATTITSNGGTLQMNATVTPSNATNQTISWSVINGTGTATINSSGLLQATGNGTVTARASATDGSGIYGDKVITISNQSTVIPTTDCTIYSAGNATTISVNGGTLQFTATVVPTNATDQVINWSVVNETGTATISVNGLLTAQTNGTVTVWGRTHDGSGAYDFKQITLSNQGSVTIPTTDLTVYSAGNATTITTYHGTLQFTVTVVPINATDQTANWSVVNGTGTATISASGLLTATGNGTVTVWAYAHDGSGAYDFKTITLSNQTNVTIPTLTTTAISSIRAITASSGGVISTDGGATITAKGVCWGTSINPTTANSKTSDGTGTATFSSAITGLTGATTYHVRAYATNSAGTAYGNDITFVTSFPTGVFEIVHGGKRVTGSGKILIVTQ